MKDIILIGGGEHCKAVIDVIESERKFNIIGIVEKPDSEVKKVLGYDVIGNDEIIPNLLKEIPYALITIGQIKNYCRRFQAFRNAHIIGAIFPLIVSPNAYVSKTSQIGSGTVVMHGVIINSLAIIGQNVILNSKCLIEHDVYIGNHCHISTGAIINGGVTIGDKSFIGSGAIIRNGIKIGAKSFIGMGCLVENDVAPESFIKNEQ